MKNKKLNKKLSLNKSTIANLGQSSMRGIRGGDLPTGGLWTCSPKCGTDVLSGCIPCEDPTATCNTQDEAFTCVTCECLTSNVYSCQLTCEPHNCQ